MVIKVGINGFGRVGRVVLRNCLECPDVQIAAINDPAVEVEYICYLIKFDSTHGTLKHNVLQKEDEIQIGDLSIKVFNEKLPQNIPWHKAEVQYVVESSGMFTSLEKASGHLGSECVKRVIVTAPSVDVPMVIFGVNESNVTPECKVISCCSSTLYCLAPIVKVLEDGFGVEEGFVTSIHAMTPSLKPLDGLCIRGKHWRDHRSITQNIIPAVTGACRALGRIIPSVKDKFCGLAFRVPIANVSVLDLTVRLKKHTSLENIVSSVEKFKNLSKQMIMTTSNEESVSSDFVGSSHSCTLDVGSSLQLNPNSFKLICWYENEYSYACRVIDLILFSEDQLKQQELIQVNKSTFVKAKCYNKQDVNQQTESNLEILNKSCELKDITVSKIPIAEPKRTQRPMLIKKPTSIPTLVSGLNYNTKSNTIAASNQNINKKIELFKIWNDENKESRKTQQKPLFQQTYNFTPQTVNKDCYKAQEKLEMVKKEFTKMVSITEDLLRKSYNSKLRLSSLEPSKEELEEAHIDVKIINKNDVDPNYSESFHIHDTLKGNEPIVDVSRDTNSTNTTNTKLFDSSKEEVNYIHYKKENSSLSIMNECAIPIQYQRTSLESESMKRIDETKKITNVSIQDNSPKDEATIELINSNRSFISKTFSNLFDGFSKNFQFQSLTNTNENFVKCDEQKAAMKNSENISETDNIAEATSNETENVSPLPTVKSNNSDKKVTTAQVMDIDNVPLKNLPPDDGVGELENENPVNDLRQPNIDCKLSMDTNKMDKADDNIDLHPECGDYVSAAAVGGSKLDAVQKRECSYTSMPESLAMTGIDDLSRCSSPQNYKNKQDIFDKLDSTSASSSENSFEVDGRKSQVIKISDLTNSLDDLERLDKICRIMEISDELSSKLFSALDESSNSASITNKKWSFKDLCEKINLDEFCAKVFGK